MSGQTEGGTSGARPTVKVSAGGSGTAGGGSASELPEAAARAIRTAAVETDLDGPDSCRLVFDDPGRTVLAGSGIDVATGIEVYANRADDATLELVFHGVVYALGFELDERGTYATVSAYDRSYPLYNGSHTRTYQDTTDSGLAEAIAGEVGLGLGTVDATDVTHRHIAQVNETHIQFLRRRARAVGRVVRVVGNRLDFARPTAAAQAPEPADFGATDRLQLVGGDTVQRLSVRLSAAQQVGEVEVRGWNPAEKRAVVATAPARTTAASVASTPASLASTMGDPRQVVVDVPMCEQPEADVLAQARAERIAGAHLHAEGVALGDPRIVAGAAASLGATGGRFDGGVVITQARHTWDSRGYRTSFVAGGGHDRSLLGLVAGGTPQPDGRRVAGLVVGVVTQVADDQGYPHVKLRFPWLDDAYESDWVRVVQPGAGSGRGLQLPPEVHDEVLVGFEHGDLRRPYVLGGLHNASDPAPRAGTVDTENDMTVTTRLWRSRSGHEIAFEEGRGEADKGSVTIRAAESKATVVLDSSGTVTVTTTGDAGNVTVTASGDLALSGKNVAISGDNVTITADRSSGSVSVTGKSIALN